MGTMSRPVKDLFVATGYATDETTAAAFLSGASTGEIAVFQLDGAAAPASGEGFYLLYKKSDGTIKASTKISDKQLSGVTLTKTDPTTIVPAYSSWTVSTTGIAAGDVYNGFFRISNFGSRSVLDEYPQKFDYVFQSGDDYDDVAEGLIKSMSYNFSKVEGQQSQYVNFKTGYVAVYATEAAALAGKASLDNDDLIWVIQHNKPYTWADDTATTFATLATEKTDWSSELTAGTAEYLPDNPWFHFIKTDGTSPVITVTAKLQSGVDEKIHPYDIEFAIGLETLDYSNTYAGTAVTVTNVAKARSAGDGKDVRALEVFAAGHTGDFYRKGGWPNNFDASYVSSVTTNYYMVNINFKQKDKVFPAGLGDDIDIIVACSTSAVATSLYNAINTAIS